MTDINEADIEREFALTGYGAWDDNEYTLEEKKECIRKHKERKKAEKEFFENYMPPNEFIEGTDYLFFTMENANFACRNILVPTKEFSEIYPDVLEMLRENAKTTTNETGLKEHVLTIFYKFAHLNEDGRIGTWLGENTPISRFSGGMMTFAEGRYYGYLGDVLKRTEKPENTTDKDRVWFIKSVCEDSMFFDPKLGITSLITAAEKHGCTVSESFIFEEERELTVMLLLDVRSYTSG